MLIYRHCLKPDFQYATIALTMTLIFTAQISDLIKQNERNLVIAMVRLHLKLGIVFVFLTLFATSTCFIAISSASEFTLSQDTTAPNIWDWGYYGHPNESEPFSVWANVTDNEGGVGIENVTINISGPNVTVHDLMTYNGSFYEADVDAFPNPGEFVMVVRAMDLNNNTRDGRIIRITIEDVSDEPIDPIMTLPVVVASSSLLAVIVIVAALLYDRKQKELAIGEEPSEKESSDLG